MKNIETHKLTEEVIDLEKRLEKSTRNQLVYRQKLSIVLSKSNRLEKENQELKEQIKLFQNNV